MLSTPRQASLVIPKTEDGGQGRIYAGYICKIQDIPFWSVQCGRESLRWAKTNFTACKRSEKSIACLESTFWLWSCLCTDWLIALNFSLTTYWNDDRVVPSTAIEWQWLIWASRQLQGKFWCWIEPGELQMIKCHRAQLISDNATNVNEEHLRAIMSAWFTLVVIAGPYCLVSPFTSINIRQSLAMTWRRKSGSLVKARSLLRSIPSSVNCEENFALTFKCLPNCFPITSHLKLQAKGTNMST